MDDDAIRELVSRLSRPHTSGGASVDRSAVLAEGAAAAEILQWITDHDGQPEAAAAAPAGRGLHAARAGRRAPLNVRRYILPPGSLS